MTVSSKTTQASPGVSREIDILRDEAYFLSHQEDLMRDFPDKYVAVRGEELVVVADDLREVHEALLERYGKHVYAFVRKVCVESFAPPGEPNFITL